MKLKPLLILFALLIFSSSNSSASPVLIGGYDVAKIANDTISILETKGLINKGEFTFKPKESTDALVIAPEVIKFYENLSRALIQKKIVTDEDIKKVEALAAESGGIKSGGQNPVVLAAGFLNLLSEKGIIDTPAAQKILDGAKSLSPRP